MDRSIIVTTHSTFRN